MTLTADDLRPLIAKLTVRERQRLARLALTRPGMSAAERDAAAYRLRPVAAEEFAGSDTADPLAWEAEGWEEFQ